MIFRSNFLAFSISWGIRAIEPSSFMISIRAAAGWSPAKRAMSTAASVCPARLNTPLFCAYKGLICPGRPKVAEVELGSANAWMVAARSWADTPVVQPSSLSMVTVKGVPNIEVLLLTCLSSSNSAQRSSVIGAHNTPRPSFSMKFTFSGVIFSAAIMKSPSFSRSSSSTTMINLPSRKSAIASSMVFSLKSSIVKL